jgi:short-subunit dehydrogenase
MDIKDKTIWITGASAGIGEALAIECAKQGATLILSARSIDKLNQLKDSLPNPERHIVLPLDLSVPEKLSEQVSTLINTQPIDILINNGGISQRSKAIDTQLSVQRQVMEVNYFGTIALTQCVLPRMIEAKKGMIVTIASVAGKVGGQSMSGYSASKHAIVGYMDCLRAEESCNGLQVLTICPGFVQTNISVNAMTEDGKTYGRVAKSIKNGITVDICATKIVNAIKANKSEVIIGTGLSYWAPTIYKFFPSLFRKLTAAKK